MPVSVDSTSAVQTLRWPTITLSYTHNPIGSDVKGAIMMMANVEWCGHLNYNNAGSFVRYGGVDLFELQGTYPGNVANGTPGPRSLTNVPLDDCGGTQKIAYCLWYAPDVTGRANNTISVSISHSFVHRFYFASVLIASTGALEFAQFGSQYAINHTGEVSAPNTGGDGFVFVGSGTHRPAGSGGLPAAVKNSISQAALWTTPSGPGSRFAFSGFPILASDTFGTREVEHAHDGYGFLTLRDANDADIGAGSPIRRKRAFEDASIWGVAA